MDENSHQALSLSLAGWISSRDAQASTAPLNASGFERFIANSPACLDDDFHIVHLAGLAGARRATKMAKPVNRSPEMVVMALTLMLRLIV